MLVRGVACLIGLTVRHSVGKSDLIPKRLPLGSLSLRGDLTRPMLGWACFPFRALPRSPSHSLDHIDSVRLVSFVSNLSTTRSAKSTERVYHLQVSIIPDYHRYPLPRSIAHSSSFTTSSTNPQPR
mgnify:CR=1 FL=1|jgi:hypothetical protein